MLVIMSEEKSVFRLFGSCEGRKNIQVLFSSTAIHVVSQTLCCETLLQAYTAKTS